MSMWTPPPEDAPRRLADLRVSYDLGTLAPEDLPANPLDAFHGWFAETEAAELPEPNAMVVSTADASGAPSSRTVLLKDADSRGFVFYTNLESRKSRELAENPHASLVFPWFAIHRQVTVVGTAELIGRDEVEAYYRSRPRGSQLGAWASAQSTVIDGVKRRGAVAIRPGARQLTVTITPTDGSAPVVLTRDVVVLSPRVAPTKIAETASLAVSKKVPQSNRLPLVLALVGALVVLAGAGSVLARRRKGQAAA